MSLKEIIDATLFFVSQWCGTTAPRIASAFVGLILCVLTVTGLWERRLRAVAGILQLIVGILLVVIGLDTQILHWLVATDYVTRVRLLMGLLSVVVLGVTLEAIRRDQLKERYALLWVATGLVVLLCAFFPQVLSFLTALLGVQYSTAVVAVVFTFLVLVVFHFSIVLSGFHDNQTRIAQRCALLEERLDQLAAEVAALKGVRPPAAEVPALRVQIAPSRSRPAEPVKRRWHGSIVAIPLIILLATLAVLVVGLATPQPMIGDEVTHYYMLVHQEQAWPVPNFKADIPMGWGGIERRNYPHTFLWHYLGATLARVLGHSFALVQVYQALFWLQFLVAAFYLARGRGGAGDRRSILLFLIILASLPMGIIFSVAFYQDVPVAAQVLTAFCLADRRRWIWASLLMAVALAMKETAILFLPAYFVFLGWRMLASAPEVAGPVVSIGRRVMRWVGVMAVAATVVGVSMGLTARALRSCGEAEYYPIAELQRLIQRWQTSLPAASTAHDAAGTLAKTGVAQVTPYEVEIIANHPGDLRRPVNFIIYGGALLWVALLLGIAGRLWTGRTAAPASGTSSPALWPLLVGLSYCLPLAYVLRTAPDARFFLPGIPFLLLPFAQWAVRLPRPQLIISIIATLAILQGGQVLDKTYRLRQVSPDLRAGIEFLRAYPPSPRTVFMYPEGNYRLFSVPHEWYLGYRLREFWKGDNDTRIDMLRHHGVGAIVVKKHLITPVDEAITDLGVYPDYFVRSIEADPRFRKVFDNAAVSVYLVPASVTNVPSPAAAP